MCVPSVLAAPIHLYMLVQCSLCFLQRALKIIVARFLLLIHVAQYVCCTYVSLTFNVYMLESSESGPLETGSSRMRCLQGLLP